MALEVPYRALGKTGEKVSAIGLGGWHLGLPTVSEDLAIRLIRTALPRIRDFRGVSPRSFDGRGNYTLGVKDQTIFPEVELDKVKRNLGMDITIVTTAKTDEEAAEFLSAMGLPIQKGTSASSGLRGKG